MNDELLDDGDSINDQIKDDIAECWYEAVQLYKKLDRLKGWYGMTKGTSPNQSLSLLKAYFELKKGVEWEEKNYANKN